MRRDGLHPPFRTSHFVKSLSVVVQTHRLPFDGIYYYAITPFEGEKIRHEVSQSAMLN
jgi:hypothetical protein